MAVSAQNGPPIIRFSIFEVDLQAGELRRNGLKVKLQEQPFQILAVLLEKPGEVFTREQLRSRLWPADTFVDFDHGLNAAVRRLRDALGDSAETPRFVETVSRRGYRFIAPVNGNSLADNQFGGVSSSVPFLRAHIFWVLGISIVLVVLGIGLGLLLGRPRQRATQVTERRLTANPSEDPVAAGVISPDGKYLAFSDETGFYLRQIENGDTHAVPLPKAFHLKPASWFPDGGHLVAVGPTQGEQNDALWDVSIFGGAPRKLIDDGSHPSISPDGSQIAFLRGAPAHHKLELGRHELWLMQGDGERPRLEVRDSASGIGEVAWSPDGRLLAYIRDSYTHAFYQRSAHLEVRDPSSGKSETVFSNLRLGRSLAWTRDGRLIYSLVELPPNQDESNLWSVRVDARGHLAGSPTRISSDSGFDSDITLSADGKRLALVKQSSQPDVYVADLENDGARLSTPRRLTLDERQDYPFAWTPDSKAVLFASDRDGIFHIFKQQTDQPTPELLVGGDRTLLDSRLSPDGNSVLYLSQSSLGEGSGKIRIMRVPLSGGAPQVVLEGIGINNQQCARLPSATCIYSEIGPEKVTFFSFDAQTGQSREMPQLKIQSNDYYDFNWSLSPDGNTLATSGGYDNAGAARAVLLLPLHAGPQREIPLRGWDGISSLDWAADGRSLWMIVFNNTGKRVLIDFDLEGKAQVMLEEDKMTLGWAIPSPDGRHLALWEASGSSNVWMLENF